MNCSEVRDKLMDYASEELPESDAHGIQAHLAICDGCRAELQRAREACEMLSLLASDEPAPAILPAVRERLAREHAPAHPYLRRGLAAALTAACVLLAVILWTRTTPPRRTVVRRPATESQIPVRRIERSGGRERSFAVHPASRKIARERSIPHRRHIAYHPPHTPPIPIPAKIQQHPDLEESAIFIALTPRSPESYVIKVTSDDQTPPSELSVVREYDVGGNVTSVTISDSVPEPANPETPPSNVNSNDAQPRSESIPENQNPGGYHA